MALTHTIKGPNPMDLLEVWIIRQREESGNQTEIETTGYYFPGDGTLIFWYEIIPVNVVVVLDERRKRHGAPR